MKPVMTRAHMGGAGVQLLFRFDNGYGASVVPEYDHTFPGGMWDATPIRGMWGLTVIIWTSGMDYEACDDSPLGAAPLTYQADQDIQMLLDAIESWPRRKE